MTGFSLNNELDVLTATIWGEARGCMRNAMENVAQCVLNRAADEWDRGGVIGVCLAPLQFSSWNEDDPNRADIFIAAKQLNPEPSWKIARLVATVALAGHNPNRIQGADSYFAVGMARPPYWAKAPAIKVYSDGWHAYWVTRNPPHAPVISVNSNLTADDLNKQELTNLGGA